MRIQTPMQSEFPGNIPINRLLPDFYRKYNLNEDGGLGEATVKVEVYKNFRFYLPNIDARKKAVLKHDIHHIITGYKSDFKGETEIGAWEIASGCRKYWVATVLDLASLALGCLFNLPGVFRAFIRGRRMKNLYDDTIPDAQAVSMTVDELREKLGLNIGQRTASVKEVLSFIGWGITGAIYSVCSIIVLPAVIVYSIVIALKKNGPRTI